MVVIRAVPRKYQAGEVMLPVAWVSQVAMKGAVPPKRAMGVLNEKAKTVARILAGIRFDKSALMEDEKNPKVVTRENGSLIQDRCDGWNDRCHPFVRTKTRERDTRSEGHLMSA